MAELRRALRPDPQHDAVRDAVTVIPVLGIPVRFVAAGDALRDAVESTFGCWHDLDPREVERRSPVHVRLTMQDARYDEPGVVHRSHDGTRLVVRACGSSGTSDVARGEAHAYITAGLLADVATFRREMLEALVLWLLTSLDRQPFHAAAVSRGDSALLLHGPSGAGKSALARAAAAAGVDVIGDDVVYLQSRPSTRVWGMQGHLHLLPADAAAADDEAAGPLRVRNGRAKVAVPLPRAARRGVYDRIGICVLGDRRGAVALERLSGPDTLQRLDLPGPAGFDRFADTITPILRQLTVNGAWLLHPSSRPADAVPYIRAMLAELDSSMGAQAWAT